MTGTGKYDQNARVFDYSAEGGSLLIGTPSFNAQFGNGYGDGTFCVVIDDSEGRERYHPDGFDFVDAIGGDGDYHVYPRDYEAVDPLVTLAGRWGVFRASDGNGDMRLVSWGGTVVEVTAEGYALDDYPYLPDDDGDDDEYDDDDDDADDGIDDPDADEPEF